MIVGVTTGATAWFSVFVQMDVNQVPVRNPTRLNFRPCFISMSTAKVHL